MLGLIIINKETSVAENANGKQNNIDYAISV
jgi:hypothetical protein